MYRGHLNRARGFTIVELIVVIVVIGILASIAIVGYGAWQKNVAISVVKSDLTAAKSAMESVRSFKGSTGYPLAIPSTFAPSTGITAAYIRGNSKTFCIQAVSVKAPASTYYVENGGNPKLGTCP